VIADATGTVKAESDYYPWGGEIRFVDNDPNHYKFTGKERDTESQLDYFGARYCSNGLGRFITPDWSSVPAPVPYADLHDPQTLNQYSYVRNIPSSYADPDGHCWKGFQHACNWIKYEVWSDDAHLNQALEKKAQADLKQMREWGIVIVNDKGQVQSSDQYFAGKSNQEIVDGFREIEYGRTHSEGMPLGIGLETHHLLPREFERQFKAKGLDIEEYTYNLPKSDHRLKPDGLHTGTGRGGDWNQAWRDFFAKNPDPAREQILQQLDSMMRQFGLK
jgi:RHS repeat-associated protein